MKDRARFSAFYIEALLLVLILVAVILTLAQVFALGQVQSRRAKLLTEGVCLAVNAAEAASASDSPEKLASLLDEDGNTEIVKEEVPTVRAFYSPGMRPDPDGELVVDIRWDLCPGESGSLARVEILVTERTRGEQIYSMETAVFLPEAGV